MKSYFGQLRVDSTRDVVELWVDGEALIDNIDISAYPDVPFELDLIADLEGDILRSWSPDPSAPDADRTTRKDVAGVYVVDHGIPIKDEHWDKARSLAKGGQDEYRRLAQGRWEVNFTPYVINNKEGGHTGLRGVDWRYVREQVSLLNPGHRHNYWHGIGGWSSQYCGVAWLGGNEAWTYPSCGLGTFIHEQGHNFRAGHSGTLTGGAYGERRVWQGTGGIRDDHSTPHLALFGLIEDEHVASLSAGESAMFYLTQGSTSMLSMNQREQKLVIVRTNDTLIKRLAISYHDGNIDVHRPASEGSTRFAYTTRLASLSPGESTTWLGVTIHYLEGRSGVGAVWVAPEGESGIPGTQFPLRAYPSQNYNPLLAGGLWANYQWTVQGVHVVPLPPERNQVMVSWLTWTRKHRHRWMTMVGDIGDDGVVRGELRQGDVPVGHGSIYFTDARRGIFYAYTPETGKFAMPLERISAGTGGFYGIGEGEGMTMTLDGDRAVAYLLLNEEVTHLSPSHVAQVWRMAVGPPDHMTVYEIRGGMIGVKADFEMEPAGTLSIDGETVVLDGNQRETTRLA